MKTTKRCQKRYQPGMVYGVPLSDGSFGIAQAYGAQGEFVNVIYVALFSNRYDRIPKEMPQLDPNLAVCLHATWKQALNRGEWKSIGVVPELFKKSDFPNERYVRNGYIGATNSDAGLLSKFLSAYHGLLPWNVMFDPHYYDEMLRSGLTRPTSSLVLNDEERDTYRREVLGVST